VPLVWRFLTCDNLVRSTLDDLHPLICLSASQRSCENTLVLTSGS